MRVVQCFAHCSSSVETLGCAVDGRTKHAHMHTYYFDRVTAVHTEDVDTGDV